MTNISNKFQAIAVNRETGQRITGELSLSNYLNFASDDNTLNFHFGTNDLQISIGGGNNRLIFLNSGEFHEYIILTNDNSLLYHHCFDDINDISSLRKSSNNYSKTIKIAVGLFISFILFLTTIFYFSEQVITVIANNTPISIDKEIGRALISTSTFNNFIKDKEVINEFQKLINYIDTNNEFVFYIDNNDEINAFALPGGYIIINKGLINNAESPEEILGVIAHEIGHVNNRHHLRSLIKGQTYQILINIIFLNSSGGDIANLSNFLLQMKTSREFEFEADKTAYDLLKKQNICTNGMIVFFQRLNEQDNKAVQNLKQSTSLFSTHPPNQIRIEKIHLLQEKSSTNKSQTIKWDLSSFKSLLQNKTKE